VPLQEPPGGQVVQTPPQLVWPAGQAQEAPSQEPPVGQVVQTPPQLV